MSDIRYLISDIRIRPRLFRRRGREVAVLVDERKAPGNYEVKFDGSNRASGVYFYRIRAGDFTQTKQLVLVK